MKEKMFGERSVVMTSATLTVGGSFDAAARSVGLGGVAAPQWDGNMLRVQLNDIREKSMEIRCLAGVHNARDATDLRAEVREAVITWLQREYPNALPRNGIELDGSPSPPSPASEARPGPGDQRVQ